MDLKVPLPDKLQLCPACLCIGRTLQTIADHKHESFYLNILREIPLCNKTLECPSVCWECAALLSRSASFTEQVKDSFRILQTYTKENLTECLFTEVIRPPRLKTHQQPSIDIVSDTHHAELEVHDHLDTCETVGTQVVFMKDEPKTEWNNEVKLEQATYEVERRSCRSNSSNDLDQRDADVQSTLGESPVPENDSTKKRKGKKVPASIPKKAKKTVKALKSDKKGAGAAKPPAARRVVAVEVSFEELMEERARDAQREPFASAALRCDSCLVAFSYSGSYAAHMASRHAPELGEFTCPVCKTVMASVDSFTAHYKRHLRRFECGACGRRAADRRAALQHYDVAHERRARTYTCAHCGVLSHTIDAHRYHKDVHKARVECPECDKTFSHRAGLMNHRIAVHKLNNTFPCSACDKVFRWKTSLKKHMESHDRKGKPRDAAARCEPCGVHFASVCSYQRHLRHSLRHVTPEQHKFTCDECGRRYANKTKLRDHIEEKHLHRTYQCHICLKPSKNRVCLDQHIRNVHKGRPNNKMCHHCGKGFPTKVQLESHIRSHTGERPYICEFCPTTFSQQSNLYKHNRQIHLNIKSKRYAVPPRGGGEGSAARAPPAPAPAPPAPLVPYAPDKQFVLHFDGGSNVAVV